MRYFYGRTGWPDTYEKSYEMRIGSLPLSWNGRITQDSFWARARQFKKHETGPHQLAEARPEEKVLARYSGLGLVCAVDVDFGFLNKFLS